MNTRLDSPPFLLGFDRVMRPAGLLQYKTVLKTSCYLRRIRLGRAICGGAGGIVLLDSGISGY
jgi:hypothetical protein